MDGEKLALSWYSSPWFIETWQSESTVFGWAKPVGMLDILRNSHRNSLLNPNSYLLHLSVSIVHQQFRRKASRPKLVASYLRIFLLSSQRLMANFKWPVEMVEKKLTKDRIWIFITSNGPGFCPSTVPSNMGNGRCEQFLLMMIYEWWMDVTLSWADTHV